MFDDHHSFGVAMAPAFVPAVIAMFAEFGPCAEVPMVAVPDYDILGTGNRRRRDGDHTKRRNQVSKLLHNIVLLV